MSITTDTGSDTFSFPKWLLLGIDDSRSVVRGNLYFRGSQPSSQTATGYASFCSIPALTHTSFYSSADHQNLDYLNQVCWSWAGSKACIPSSSSGGMDIPDLLQSVTHALMHGHSIAIMFRVSAVLANSSNTYELCRMK